METRLPIEQPAPMLARDADARAVADDHVRSDIHQRSQIHARADHGRGVDARLQLLRGMKAARARAQKPCAAPPRGSRCGSRPGEIERDQQAAGGGGFGLARRFQVGDERNVRSAGGLERGDAGDILFTVAFERGPQPFGQFANSHVL